MEPRDHSEAMTAESGGQAGTAPSEEAAPAILDPPTTAPAAAPAPATGGEELPKIVLVQAGLAVFNGVMAIVYLGLWFFAGDLLFQILQRAAGFSLLLGLAPILLGSYILHVNKRAGAPMPGTPYATAGIWIGIAVSMMTVIFPMLVTLRSLFATPGVS